MSENQELLSLSEEAANELTFQQEQFALTWLANGGNGTRAAEEAGYANGHVAQWRLLRNEKVVKFIEAKRAERRGALDLQLPEKHVKTDRLLAELSEIAGLDLGDILDELGRNDRTKLKGKAKQLQSVEIDGGKTKVKGPDRLAAIRLLMDHFGMLSKQQVNVQVNVGFAERMAMRRARALDDRG